MSHQLPAQITHYPYVLKPLREGCYHAFRGEKRIAKLYQQPANADRRPGQWRVWPGDDKGPPGGFHGSLESAIEELPEFDPQHAPA